MMLTVLAASADVPTLQTPEFWVAVAFFLFIGLLIYKYGINNQRMGIACAMSVVVLLCIFALTLVKLRLLRYEVQGAMALVRVNPARIGLFLVAALVAGAFLLPMLYTLLTSLKPL